MLFNSRNHNIKRCLLFSTFLVSLLSMTLILLSSDTYAATTNDYYSGSLFLTASVCRRDPVSGGGYYYNCGSDRNVSISASTSNNLDIAFTLTQRSNSNISSDLNDRCTGYSDSCYLLIKRVMYYPKVSSSDSSTHPVLNDFIYARLMTTNFLELGTLKDYYSNAVSTNENYYNTLFGIDAYFNFNASGQYSCLDSIDFKCDMRYYFNHDPTDLTASGLYNSFVVSAQVGVNKLDTISFVLNPYDQSNSAYTRNPYDSLLYVIQVPNYNVNNNPTIFQAFVRFYTSDEFIEINDSAGIDPDNPDWDIIQDNAGYANESNAALGNISLPIFNPISSFLGLFTDTQCITISQVPSWFGLPSQYLCSPWKDPIRSIISGIMVFAGTMLTFGFVISWLRGGTSFGRDVDGLERYWFE